MAYVSIHVASCVKAEHTWIVKWLGVINDIQGVLLFKTASYITKELKIKAALSLK